MFRLIGPIVSSEFLGSDSVPGYAQSKNKAEKEKND